ncbi:MAG TPA: hypothetical protein PK926_06830 [Spirochaetota bacterium]|nr:hypothetical protein [Spirochaetota bacterium]HPI90035.1 hypothetical protein [Spirochaetota bacterium]HPR48083.1 hypothetical protein [Spirochaetota bacterium]
MKRNGITYIGDECKKELTLFAGHAIPHCHGKPVEEPPLDYCTSAAHPEMARNSDEDAPCDDNRG